MPYTRVSALQALIPRSQSDTSYCGLASVIDKRQRRGSDWTPREDGVSHVVLRPLQLKDQLNDVEKNSLLYRRLSRGGTVGQPKSSSTCSSETSSKDVARSQSMKSTRKSVDLRRRHRGSSIPSEVTCSAAKVQQRTVSNRSLPLPGDESDYTRLRNFSVTSKGVINRGDSFRSKPSSNANVLPSTIAFGGENVQRTLLTPDSEDGDLCAPVYKVLLVGSQDVGKTSVRNQFMTSEYICASDSIHDYDKAVTIVLNSEESQLEFQEETLTDKNMAYVNNYQPDAFVVVYSVASRGSFLLAKHLLYHISHNVDYKTIILVANKTDLARLRMVSTEEGRSLAKEQGCKFIEVSVAINHQVDELLVGILTQIRMKSRLTEKQKASKKKRDSQSKKSSIYTGSKASGVLKKILQRACLKSKSCDNLHVL